VPFTNALHKEPKTDAAQQTRRKVYEALLRLGRWCPACGCGDLFAEIESLDNETVRFVFGHNPLQTCRFEMKLEPSFSIVAMFEKLLASVHAQRGTVRVRNRWLKASEAPGDVVEELHPLQLVRNDSQPARADAVPGLAHASLPGLASA
jgi:hypothetical protein